MRAIRSKDSKAEVLIRSLLHRLGLRYRKHPKLPGRPDILFSASKVAVFVDGDFWHGRILIDEGEEAFRSTFKNSDTDWWIAKIKATVRRDSKADQMLREIGYISLRFWERDIYKDANRISRVIAKIVRQRRVELIRSHSESSKPTLESLSANC